MASANTMERYAHIRYNSLKLAKPFSSGEARLSHFCCKEVVDFQLASHSSPPACLAEMMFESIVSGPPMVTL